jgi:hypothetical protein
VNWRVLLVAGMLGLAVVGCGSKEGGSTDRPSYIPSQQQRPKRPAEAHPEQAASRWTGEEKQQFETNRFICSSETQAQLAKELGVHNDIGSIAHADGLEYRNRMDMQIAAEEGCLKGLGD